jgi:hypothetical protein
MMFGQQRLKRIHRPRPDTRPAVVPTAPSSNSMRTYNYNAIAFTGADWFGLADKHPVRDLAWDRPFLLVVPMSGLNQRTSSTSSNHPLVLALVL